jgi:hypothetical protein
MATPPRLELSSAFDDMLTKSRDSFAELYRHGGMPGIGTMATMTPAVVGVRLHTGSPAIEIDPGCEPARRLNERFGHDWRYQITEQRRDGDEAIVLCKLTFGKEAAVRAQFGRAKIGRSPVIGTGDGVRFSLDAGGGAQDEHEAFRRAAEAALMNCLELI